ncbi:MAG: META domain-containing protein [Muribaculaceae bacterium]|nr:META domain-containing protein [Muribaculaceae bacterium]
MRTYCIFTAITYVWLLTVISCTTDNPLIGTWNVITYTDPFGDTNEAITVSSGEIFTLQFHNNSFFSFTTDCNTISGEFALSGKQIHFLNLYATEIACDKVIVERSVKSQLPVVDSYDLTNDSILYLYGKQGNVLMKLVKAQNKLHNI